MLARTHILFSILLILLIDKYNSYFSFIGAGNIILFSIVLLFFTLLPDIDTTSSYFGKKVWPFSFVIKHTAGHRTFFHSIYLPLIFFLTLLLFDYQYVAYAALFGYLSHLVMDALTKEGIQPLFPLKYRIAGFFKTGGVIELLFSVFLLVLVLYMFI